MKKWRQYRPVAPELRIAIFAATLGLMILGTAAAQAQTYTVIHEFTGGDDGAAPESTLAIDQAGNLYGTASSGGSGGAGVAFKMKRDGSNWLFMPLYEFQGTYDGYAPWGPITIGPDGALYGTTLTGGGLTRGEGPGVVYRLRPPATAPASVITPWTETLVHTFTGGMDGAEPAYPQLFFDQAQNIYGATSAGGMDFGVVFELTPSGDGWTNNTLYGGFTNGPTGGTPLSGVVMDNAGNLYGTTSIGGAGGDGVVYEISPAQDGWVETVLHNFRNGDDGGLPFGGLVIDQAGNLYGGTLAGGANGCGVVYELSPSGGGWTFAPIYTFACPGEGPYETLTLDAAGSLYGTTSSVGGHGDGMVFKLTKSDGVWTLTDLHDFSSEHLPYGGVTIGANGNLYGTTSGGGTYGKGVVWEITP